MKQIIYLLATCTFFLVVTSCNNASSNSNQESRFGDDALDTCFVESVVCEEETTEYVDTATLFAEEEAKVSPDIYAVYTFTDRGNDNYTLTLKTDNTVIFEEEGSSPRYGSWHKRENGIDMLFKRRKSPVVWVNSGHEDCWMSAIRDGYFYPSVIDAAAKDPDGRVEMKRVQ